MKILKYIILFVLLLVISGTSYSQGGFDPIDGNGEFGCQVSISPSSSYPVSKEAGSFTIAVNTGNVSCNWTVTCFSPWVQISPSSGYGNGVVTVTYSENIPVTTRPAYIMVGDQHLELIQAAGCGEFIPEKTITVSTPINQYDCKIFDGIIQARDLVKLDNTFAYSAANNAPLTIKTDAKFLCDADYQNELNPSTRNINLNTVGSLPGNYNVSTSGSLDYSVPLDIPAGIAGMQPGIALIYNSMGGNGQLGVSWDLAGLSSISRIPETSHYRTMPDGVDLQANDRFALDGNKLLVTNGGVYGASNTIYGTESNTFSQITSYGVSGTGPSWFKVETKTGTVMEYGNTEDSRVEASGNSTVLTWRLNKVRDINGNYIKFIYKEQNGESWIDRIEYTGNEITGFSPLNKIHFYYENRTDINSYYIGGSDVPETVLLRSIKTETNNTMVNEYKLKYTNDFYSHLTEITKYASDGNHLNSTIINWGATAAQYSKSSQAINDENKEFYFGDFNGDGKDDYLETLKTGGSANWNLWRLYIADQTGTTFTMKDEHTMVDQGAPITFYVADMDNDGKDEIYRRMHYDNAGVQLLCNIYNDTILKYDENRTVKFLGAPFNITFKLGDFDGNGSKEFIPFTVEKNLYGVTVPNFNNPDRVETLDFNGDGKTDIMVIKDNSCKIYTIKSFAGNFESIYSGNFPTNQHQLYMGDFNGDGKTDLLTYYNGWQLSYSTGTGFELSDNTPDLGNINPANSNYTYNYFVKDFNGDTKDDILKTYLLTSASSSINVFYSTGNGSFIEESNNFSRELSNNSKYKFGDFNGDGIEDVFYRGSAGTNREMISFHQFEKRHLVHSITDGFNRTVQIEYAPLSERGFLYPKGKALNFAVSNIHGSFNVVKKVSSSNGLGGIHELLYSYEDATNGVKGFAGFKKMTVTDPVKAIKNITINELEDEFSTLKKQTTEVRLTDNSLISRNVVEYAIKKYGSKYFSYPVYTASYDAQTGITSRKDFLTYDNYGNVLTAKETTGTAVVNITNSYEQKGAWIPSRLTSSTSTRTYGTGDPNPFTKTSNFTYYDNGNVHTSVASGVTNTVEYDAYGNVIKQKQEATGVATTEVLSSYDDTHRFVKTSTNVLGQTSTYNYNGLGQLVSQTGIDGLTVSYTYDNWGRRKTTTLPNGKTTTNNTYWEGDGSGKYYASVQTEGYPEVRTYFDVLGRKYKEESTGFNGLMRSEVIYNAKGQVEKTIAPYYVSEGYTALHQTSFEYYGDGKVHTATSNGLTKTMTYNGKTVTETFPSGETKVTTIDDAGVVQKVNNKGADVNYAYYNHGQLKEVTAPGSTISLTYDANGFKDLVIDPNAGTYDYNYNVIGQLTSLATPIGSYSYSYDAAGRLSTQTENESSINYSYIANGNGLNQLDKITDNQGVVFQNFNYDNYGRVTEITERVADKKMSLSNAYDNDGRPTETTFTGGFKLKYAYKQETGQLEEIKDENNQTIWKLLDINSHGQIKKYKYGNNIETNVSYKTDGTMQSIVAGSVNSLTLNFDPAKGILNNRTGMFPGVQEVFTYDTRNQLQLVSSTAKPELNLSMDYDAASRMVTKSDIGTYNYNGTKPHAVSGITGVNGAYNPDNRDITYTSFGKVLRITQGNYRVEFTYGPDHQRKTMMVYLNNSLQRKVYYFGSYERHEEGGNVTELQYINTPSGLTAIYKKTNGVGEMFYVHTDHLGSIQAISSANQQSQEVKARYYYNAWGFKKNLNLAGTGFQASNSLPWLYRGFTGHEHIPEIGLVNMNGRMYDPELGSFLSPDPFVQSMDNPVNFNRYAYVLNNPLVYTDPSGYWRSKPLSEVSGGSGFHMGYTGFMGSNFNSGPSSYYYDASSSTLYRNTKGQEVSYDEVHNNYVIPNTQILGYTNANGAMELLKLMLSSPQSEQEKNNRSFKGCPPPEDPKAQGSGGSGDNEINYIYKPYVVDVYTYFKQTAISEGGPINWIYDKRERQEKVHRWILVPENSVGSYEVIGYYGKRIRTDNQWDRMPYSYTRETWERRVYDYNVAPAKQPTVWEQLIWEILKNL